MFWVPQDHLAPLVSRCWNRHPTWFLGLGHPRRTGTVCSNVL